MSNSIAELAFATVEVNTLFHKLVKQHGRKNIVAAFSYVLGSNAAMDENPHRVVAQAYIKMLDALELLNEARAKNADEAPAPTKGAGKV